MTQTVQFVKNFLKCLTKFMFESKKLKNIDGSEAKFAFIN